MNSVPTTDSAGKRRALPKRCIWTTATILILIFSAFIITFVVVPLIFMSSLELQTSYVFPADRSSMPDYNDFDRYDIDGVRNLYVNVMDEDNATVIRLGVWHVLPEYYNHGGVTFEEALGTSRYDVVIYFHGRKHLRVWHTKSYKVLRKFFHVIAMDYRGYGDSSPAKLTEDAITNDLQQLYKWVRGRTSAKIYVWGHSLGAALSTRTVAILSYQAIVPMGLILEAPFTSLKEVIYSVSPSKMFAWLPWFEATFLRPLERNGIAFKTSTDILRVNCPIMILHAEDDTLIPYVLGEKLAEIATAERNLMTQGNVTYHQFPAEHRYNHAYIFEAPELPTYIENFIGVCQAYDLGRG